MRALAVLLFLSFPALAAEGTAKPVTLKSSLLEQLRTSHDQQDWFVPVKPAIAGVTAAQASWKPQGGDHSIGQLANHLLFWNSQQLAKFKRVAPVKFDGNNDETFNAFDQARWDEVREKLDSVLTELEKLGRRRGREDAAVLGADARPDRDPQRLPHRTDPPPPQDARSLGPGEGSQVRLGETRRAAQPRCVTRPARGAPGTAPAAWWRSPMTPTRASRRMTCQVGSTSNQRAAKFGLMPNLWWLFWKSSPMRERSRTAACCASRRRCRSSGSRTCGPHQLTIAPWTGPMTKWSGRSSELPPGGGEGDVEERCRAPPQANAREPGVAEAVVEQRPLRDIRREARLGLLAVVA